MNKTRGSRSERNTAFGRELLAEADDEELQYIVEEAARDLQTPIALVTLVMENVQFFKAHYGLPKELAETRGTDRDISFCQYVVASEKPFEVEDALANEDIPKELVEKYDIRSYMGMPVIYNDVVVGSLCVLDTKPRKFSNRERKELQKLAELVNKRLSELTRQRKQSGQTLLEFTAFPTLLEIRNTMRPVQKGIDSGHATITEIGTFLKLAEQSLFGELSGREKVLRSLSRARQILHSYQSDLYNMEASLGDAEDAVDALEHVLHASTTTLLSEIAISGRELSRHATALTGGVLLPDIEEDIFISTPRPFGVSMVSMTLSMMGARLSKNGVNGRIKMSAESTPTNASLVFSCSELGDTEWTEICAELKIHTDEDPTVSVLLEDGQVRLVFSAVKTRS